MQIGIVAKKSVSALTRFDSTNAMHCSHDHLEHRGDSVNTPRATWRHSLSFAVYRAWDSNSARFERFCGCEEIGCSRVRRCAADWKNSSLMYSGNLPTFTSWSTSCDWLYAVATESCVNALLIAQF